MMESIERMLSRYTDDLNAGKRPDPMRYVGECWEEDRDELLGLIEMIDLIRENYIPEEVLKRASEEAHELVRRLARGVKK